MIKWLNRLFKGKKNRNNIISKILNVVKKDTKLNATYHKQIERILYESDFGNAVVSELMDEVKTARDVNHAVESLNEKLVDTFKVYEGELLFDKKPFVIMLVGVNGTGKTTACAKIAKMLKDQGKSVMLAAADTFRAAATEQLEYWAKKIGADFYSKTKGSDPGAVAYEAVLRSLDLGTEVLIIDTGGRVHTQSGLMSEIQKVHRSVSKALKRSPDQVILTVDSTQGQNIQNQVKIFNEFVKITGMLLSKLDGTAKGGAILGALRAVRVPVFFISNGESLASIASFKAESFVDSVLRGKTL